MGEKITNYQCPSCTGPLHFSGSTGRLECEYCGNSYSVEEVKELYAKKDEKASEMDTDWGSDGGDMRAYNCPSCGAELICDESTGAGSCPYCGNPTIVPGQFAGALKPDYIIPFKFEKKDAVEALKSHYKGKFLLPKNFTDANHINEVKGVYVPFWLFHEKASGRATYEATRSITTREGDYEVTRTSHYLVKREGNASFDEIPADASKQMPDDYMDSIEPYDYREMTDFSTAYMPGYFANKYDVPLEECAPRVDLRCRNSMADLLRSDVAGYHTVVEIDRDIQLERGQVKYAMLPVWVLNTKWKDKNYLFMMNGQTGKLVGDLPISKTKYTILRLCLIAGFTILFGLIGVGGALASLFV